MTVGELVAALSQYPPGSDVIVVSKTAPNWFRGCPTASDQVGGLRPCEAGEDVAVYLCTFGAERRMAPRAGK